MLVTVPAFAKVNLGLKVLWRREDGFHEIATVFQTISLADAVEIDVEPHAGKLVECTADVAIPGSNLAERAARRLLEELGLGAQVRIHIRKKIPMGGGLAGGSTDGAAVLLALPVLLGVPVNGTMLARLAAELGSDLPFFLLGGRVKAGGRGELLEPMEEESAVWHGVLVAPGVGISTPGAFRALARPPEAELTAVERGEIMRKFRTLVARLQEGSRPGDWSAWSENDFERVAIAAHAELGLILEQIAASGARPARMSGSGSTLYGFYESEEAAQAAESLLKSQLSGHVTGVRVERFHTISRRQYERAWHTALASLTDGTSWPPRSLVV
jgi:4-diphosphocytidyl-2-C-methyl-D-erythritol kinase